MFFSFSKLFGFFLVPSNAAVCFTLLGGVLCLTPLRRAGRRLFVFGAALIIIGGVSPLGTALLLPLEERFPPWDPSRGAPTGLIILGGVINIDVASARGTLGLGDSAERLVVLADLARRHPNARIIFTGGNSNLIFAGPSEADFTVPILISFGIARARITLETESRTTAENAAYTHKLVAPKPEDRWLLITSAFHMPRAMGSFRRVGFPVEAYPVDWRTTGWRQLLTPTGSLFDGFGRLDLAVHEWLGLVAYWATGRTSEVFPGPTMR